MLQNSTIIMMSYIFFLYLVGLIVLYLIAKKVFFQLDFFIKIALSWLIGNSFLVVVLYGFFAIKKLDLINLTNFYFIFILTLVSSFFVSIKIIKSLNKSSLINIIFLIFILMFIYPLVVDSLYSFMLGWDAVGVWLFKAKVLFISSNINSFFASQDYLYTNKSHPIGIPLLISFYYRLVNYANDQTIQLYFLCYFINLIFLVFGFLRTLFRKIFHDLINLLIALSLLSTAIFINYSHNGYVDLALSSVFTMLLVLVYFFLNEKNKEIKLEYFMLIAISVGLALVIKNEGLFFTGVVLLVTGFLALKEGIFTNWKKLLFLFIILILFSFPFIYWQIYKYRLNIHFHLEGRYLPSLSSLNRLKTLFNYYLMEMLNTNKYYLTIIPLTFLFIVELTMSIVNYQFKNKSLLLLGIFLFQIGVYTYQYIITPLPFIIGLETSLERLVLQILPCFYLLVAIFLKEFILLVQKNK